MTARARLLDLAALVERAPEADRELDALIAEAVGWTHDEDTDTGEEVWVWPGGKAWGHLPAYTASLDAALTLVPEGWRFSVDNLSAAGPLALCEHWPKSGPAHMYQRGEAATPALALTAAALRARAEEVGDE